MRTRVLAVGINHKPSRSGARALPQPKASTKGPRGFRNQLLMQVAEAKAAGFDLEFMQIKRNQMESDLAKLREKLSNTSVDLFVIGFGIRGTPEYTELFERLVNICRETTPSMMIGFNTSVDDTVEVCKRHAS